MAFAVLAQPNDPDFITLLDEAVLDVVMAAMDNRRLCQADTAIFEDIS
jgi:hypothetical protein